ncbi:MAG: sigma-70 family RNA polymerase sigma factor [Candidatus Binatus sp.]|uniref:sigma-70 family RNA polymerase sigma factor n=1 Tax=Candidatus Binatus sp. TaxID=2811406 RepID=UPI003C7533ED
MQISRDFTDQIRKAWHEFIDRTESVRPELYRYCRGLTGTIWDAEDLVQETLVRTFVRFAEIHDPIENPRAYLFRVASNLWIDRFRGVRKTETNVVPETETADTPFPRELRDAASHLVSSLPPQERAAVLLKDVFDLTLEEAALALETSVGAVKAALHRGRKRLSDSKAGSDSKTRNAGGPSAALLDRFVERFNARDLNGMVALMLEDATVEIVGLSLEHGQEVIGRKGGSLYHTLFVDADDLRQAERRELVGEQIVLLFYCNEGKDRVGDVLRFGEHDGRITGFRYYYFCPETLAEVAQEFGLAARSNGYRYKL